MRKARWMLMEIKARTVDDEITSVLTRIVERPTSKVPIWKRIFAPIPVSQRCKFRQETCVIKTLFYQHARIFLYGFYWVDLIDLGYFVMSRENNFIYHCDMTSPPHSCRTPPRFCDVTGLIFGQGQGARQIHVIAAWNKIARIFLKILNFQEKRSFWYTQKHPKFQEIIEVLKSLYIFHL